ncbi:MAG: hypothetical protein PHV74_00145 [Dehalococcoidia bacterium]|nr:hypothetical protein [Dehalococcoidia bacterium]
MEEKVAIIEEIRTKHIDWKGGAPELEESETGIVHRNFSRIKEHAVLENPHKDIQIAGRFEQASRPIHNAKEKLWFALPSVRSNASGAVRYAVEVVAYRGSYWHVLSRLVRYANGKREVLACQLGTSTQGYELSPTDFTFEASGKSVQALFSIQESNRDRVNHRLEAVDDAIPAGECVLIPVKNNLKLTTLEIG